MQEKTLLINIIWSIIAGFRKNPVECRYLQQKNKHYHKMAIAIGEATHDSDRKGIDKKYKRKNSGYFMK